MPGRFFLRASLFCAPFVLLFLSVVAIDPFNYFDFPAFVPRMIGDTVKEETAGKLHYALWKVLKFKRRPVSRIVLGDSRMDSFDMDEIHSSTGQEYFNFAYGGGTLPEAIDTYWIARKATHLDAVYLGVGLINFNEFQALNRVADVPPIQENWLLYVSNRLVVYSAMMAGYAALAREPVKIEQPAASPDAYWNFVITSEIPQLLHRYSYPTDIARRLKEVADDCRSQGTKLVFVIPPTHVDAQTKTRALGRDGEQQRFKEFLSGLGAPVIDFDYPSPFTEQRAFWNDPFHPLPSRNGMLVKEIWGDGREFSRRVNFGAGEHADRKVPASFPGTMGASR